MTTFWIKNGAVVTDGSGHPVLCGSCPCGAKSGLYIAGKFTSVGGTTMNRVAYWNGSTWAAVGSGMNDVVYDLTVYSGDLVAVGAFTTADGVSVGHTAIWNGVNWRYLGSTNGIAYCTHADSGGKLWIGGVFTSIDGVSVSIGLAWMDTSFIWHDGSSGLAFGDIPNVLYEDGSGNLYVGTQNGKVYHWTGSTWSNTGTTGQNFVNSLVVADDGKLYSAGVPTSTASEGLVRLVSGSWVAANASRNYSYATALIAGYGSWNLISANVGAGDFIRKWVGSGSPVDVNIEDTHSPRTATDTAGLGFEFLSGNPVYAGALATDGTTRVASYNGSSWSALGSQPNDDVITCRVVP